MANGKAAVFIDRDGTLNEMVYDEAHGILDSPRKPEQVVLRPGAAEFVRGVNELGYLAVIATNQPGIAKGTLTQEDLDAVNACVVGLLAEGGGRIDDVRFSPYHPAGGPWASEEFVKDSDCRKPGAGMLLAAAAEHGVDLARSWMVGDGLTDVQAGRAAGCRTMLVTRLKINVVEKFLSLDDARPDQIAPDLSSALSIIRATAQSE